MDLPIPKIPTWVFAAALFLGTATLIPFAFIARARHNLSDKPRIHIIRDMDNQERFKAQQENLLFADGRSMRQPVPGTVARGELRLDTHFHEGRVNGKWVETFPQFDEAGEPIELDADLLARGRERYEIYCAMCHGRSGYGDGMVERRILNLKLKGVADVSDWASPANYHTAAIQGQPVGEIFNTISHGKKNMAGYRAQISTRDRWAITFYVKALQASQRPE